MARDRAINNNYPGWLHARRLNPTTRGGQEEEAAEVYAWLEEVLGNSLSSRCSFWLRHARSAVIWIHPWPRIAHRAQGVAVRAVAWYVAGSWSRIHVNIGGCVVCWLHKRYCHTAWICVPSCPRIWSISWPWFETPSGQNWAKTLEKILNMSHLNCLISIPMFISHYLVSIALFMKQAKSIIWHFWGLSPYILARNCSYGLGELVGAFRALSMTLWHAEYGEQEYERRSP
jgi:hypothetical protein